MSQNSLKNSLKNGPTEKGYYGEFGGRYAPEILMPNLIELEKAFEKAINDMYQIFIEKTKGQNEIYNTDPFWNILQQDQKVFKQHINSTKKVQENIKTDYRQFQQLANKLNAK